MSIKVQVILKEEEAVRFKARALKESKSLSSWLKDAGKSVLDESKDKQRLSTPSALKNFFRDCNRREQGVEPGWEEHKKVIVEGYLGRTIP